LKKKSFFQSFSFSFTQLSSSRQKLLEFPSPPTHQPTPKAIPHGGLELPASLPPPPQKPATTATSKDGWVISVGHHQSRCVVKVEKPQFVTSDADHSNNMENRKHELGGTTATHTTNNTTTNNASASTTSSSNAVVATTTTAAAAAAATAASPPGAVNNNNNSRHELQILKFPNYKSSTQKYYVVY